MSTSDSTINSQFPFHNLDNEEYSSLFTCHTETILRPFNSDTEVSFPNWSPELCDYTTLAKYNELNFTPNNFSIIQINCRSLLHNFNNITSLIERNAPDVIAVSETWLKQGDEAYCNLRGYNFISCPRKEGRGGGVGVYISNKWHSSIIEDATLSLRDVCEGIVVELHYDSYSLIVASLYRPPAGDLEQFNQRFALFLENLSSKTSKKIFIAGDFNINLIKINDHNKTSDFFNTLVSAGFLPAVTRPTRITEFTSSLIDNIFFNSYENNYFAKIIYDDISDHLPTLLSVNLTFEPPVSNILDQTRRQFHASNFDNFKTLLADTDWIALSQTLDDIRDPNLMYDNFHAVFYSIFDKAFPRITHVKKNNKKTKPWMTLQLIRSCYRKSKLLKTYKKYPTDGNCNKYKQYANILKMTLKTAEKNYYVKQFENKIHDIKGTWNTINSVLNRNKSTGGSINLKINDKICTDPLVICNKLNNYFTNVGPMLASNIPETNVNVNKYLPPSSVNSIVVMPVDSYEIRNIISTLNNGTSPGIDGIPPSVVKLASSYIDDILTNLVNASLVQGIFPTKLKIAKVTPVYKGGSHSNCSNYRPISVLNVFAKIYETAISNRLNQYLSKSNFFYDAQFGFRRNHSTNQAIIAFSNYVTEAIDERLVAAAVFIDLSKAFDTINHSILLRKLHNYGVRGNALMLLENYLQGRTQSVNYGGHFSDFLPITCGIPQGSILGPLLFIIYINDLHRVSKLLYFILFADDTTILYKASNIEQLINNLNAELDHVSEWFQINRLSLNVSKSAYIIFGRTSYNIHDSIVKIGGEILQKVESTKFIGVEVDSNLNWKQHIQKIEKYLSCVVGMMFRLKYKLTKKAILLIYDSLIYSKIHYCNIVWASNYKTNLSKIFSLQKKALKLCQNELNRNATSSDSIFSVVGKLSVYDTNQLQIGKFIYQVVNKLAPECFNTLFETTTNIYSHNTRNNNTDNLYCRNARTNIRKFNIIVRGPRTWNSIPLDIRRKKSLGSFSSSFKKYLLNKL